MRRYEDELDDHMDEEEDDEIEAYKPPTLRVGMIRAITRDEDEEEADTLDDSEPFDDLEYDTESESEEWEVWTADPVQREDLEDEIEFLGRRTLSMRERPVYYVDDSD